VVARAGTGKTATLAMLAARLAPARCLYVAFNKSAQEDASRRFGTNVNCRTGHSLAFAAVGKRYAHKLSGSVRAFEIANAFENINFAVATWIGDVIAGWCISDAMEFPEIAPGANDEQGRNPKMAVDVAKAAHHLWMRMVDSDDPFPMTHDGYFKVWQLSSPKISASVILLDEAQDLNPVTWAVFSRQECPLILVGDPYQSIYGFRGAINAMDRVQANETMLLSESFRFGPPIANAASALLRQFFNEPEPVIGKGGPSELAVVDRTKPYAFLARTNASVFEEAAVCVTSPPKRRLGFVGGIGAYDFKKVLDTYYLWSGNGALIQDSFIRKFNSYAQYEQYVDQADDPEGRRLISCVATYGHQIPGLIETIRSSSTSSLEEADVVFSTAHRSKGLTLDQVILAEDFPELINDKGEFVEIGKDLDAEEIKLLYVAVTRARRRLQVNLSLKAFLNAAI